MKPQNVETKRFKHDDIIRFLSRKPKRPLHAVSHQEERRQEKQNQRQEEQRQEAKSPSRGEERQRREEQRQLQKEVRSKSSENRRKRSSEHRRERSAENRRERTAHNSRTDADSRTEAHTVQGEKNIKTSSTSFQEKPQEQIKPVETSALNTGTKEDKTQKKKKTKELRSELKKKNKDLRSDKNTDILGSPEPVHRLDKPTGGLLIFAKTHTASTRLGEMLRERLIQKRYGAVVLGKPLAVDGVNPSHQLNAVNPGAASSGEAGGQVVPKTTPHDSGNADSADYIGATNQPEDAHQPASSNIEASKCWEMIPRDASWVREPLEGKDSVTAFRVAGTTYVAFFCSF